MKKQKSEKKEEVLEEFDLNQACQKEKCCNQEDECHCGENCQCNDTECGEGCTCGDECHCDENFDCGCHGSGNAENFENCHCHENGDEKQKHSHSCKCQGRQDVNEYLLMAQRLQADFENYRRHVADQLTKERQEGTKSAVEVFLPCLDTFREAKKNISDENVLAGVNMIENKIFDALKTLKVEKIEALGAQFDPHLHNVIAAYADETKEDGIVLDEYQSGWTMDGKVIRYSKVVVNKRQ